MRKYYFLILPAILIAWSAGAQTYPGYRSSNYTGVNGVFFNPANIADNRFKWDLNLVAVNGFIGNDQAGLRFKDITRSLNGDSLKSKLLRGNSRVNSLAYADVLGPSVMISLKPGTSIALTTRTRVFANAKDVNGDLASAVIDAGNSSVITTTAFNSNNSITHATGWTEVGASVGQVLTPKESNHFFKAGISLKYLAGNADSYLSTDNIQGTLGSQSNAAFIAGPTTGSLAINTTDNNFSHYKVSDFFHFSGSGLGGDIGFVYEYRPTADYSMFKTDRFINKYKIKVGVAVMDIGRIHFNQATNTAANYTLTIPPGDAFGLFVLKGKSVSEFTNIFDTTAVFTRTDRNKSYSVNLPTTIQADVDWLISGGFGINFAAQLSASKKTDFNLFYNNSYNVTPRWENKTFSVMVPLNYNQLTAFNAGLSVRIGPVFFGSGSILSALFHDSKQADFHAGLHIGIPYRKKYKIDRDKDGVYDDADKCPDIAGLPRYQGCPIPDTDGDGINDEQDSCISLPGLPRYYGCPIPDSDGDSVNDEEDSCINIPGPVRFQGCPDNDDDGIPDREDKCPTVPGDARYYGCPIPDTDKDGINDIDDLCPNQAGPINSRGCPLEEVAAQLTAGFKSIQFDFGKASIRPESADLIDSAARTMNTVIPNAGFYIDGYTDNVGSPLKNKKISRARAQAVATALIGAGVDPSRVVARGFGKENPKCGNDTEEGRQCNRRVEVVIRRSGR